MEREKSLELQFQEYDKDNEKTKIRTSGNYYVDDLENLNKNFINKFDNFKKEQQIQSAEKKKNSKNKKEEISEKEKEKDENPKIKEFQRVIGKSVKSNQVYKFTKKQNKTNDQNTKEKEDSEKSYNSQNIPLNCIDKDN